MSSAENLSPQVIQRLLKEVSQLSRAPPPGIHYLPTEEESMSEIFVEIRGPEGTPYESGFFKMKLVLTEGFPQAPPKGYFLTKIYHPNISENGNICVNTLKRDWKPDLGIIHVVQVIRCLLIVPFPESSLNDEAGKLFMESYEEYARRAKLMTCIHAPKASAIAANADGGEPKDMNKDDSRAPNLENIENGEACDNSAASNGGDGGGGGGGVVIKRKANSVKTKALLDHKKAVKKRGLRRL